MIITVKTLQGLEDVLSEEILNLGGDTIEKHTRAVSFEGSKELLYLANLKLRTALKVLVPIHSFKSKDENELYHGVREIQWSEYLDADQTLAIDSAVSSIYFNHSHYVSLKCKDAIVDQFRDQFGKRPNVELHNPSVRLHIHIWQDEVSIALDSTGESLHKRGYKQDINVSPLNEVLAAGMVLMSGWDYKTPFIDPMCGSGTLLIEAAMIASNTAPGLLRKQFQFQQWKDYDDTLWNNLKKVEESKVKEEIQIPIIGSDISFGTIEAAAANVTRAGMDEHIKLSVRDIKEAKPPLDSGGVCIINPPYGERFTHSDLDNLYRDIGSTFKKNFPGYTVWVLSGNAQALKNFGLKPSKKISLLNGSIPCMFQRYELYEGTRRYGPSSEPK